MPTVEGQEVPIGEHSAAAERCDINFARLNLRGGECRLRIGVGS